jgi:hypothetical protein
MTAYELKRWVCTGYDNISTGDGQLHAQATATTPEGAQIEVSDVFEPAAQGFLLTRRLAVARLPHKRQAFLSSTAASHGARGVQKLI